MISKALVMGAYHAKLEQLASLGVDLHVILPARWGTLEPEIQQAANYSIHILECALHGKNHFHFYRGLRDVVERIHPDILHIDEESYSFVTFQTLRIAVRHSIPALFFNWQNIERHYPFPFCRFEGYAFRHVKAAIAGSEEARRVLRAKGCMVPIHVIPQFGVDPGVFCRRDSSTLRNSLFGDNDIQVVGYGGRLIEHKGLGILLEAFAGLGPYTRMLLIGSGPFQSHISLLSERLGISQRVRLIPHVASSAMPNYLACLNCLVLPSLTGRTWKEQFGRILIEAMACEVPVIGSTSGEIPNVIGDAGIVVPEGDVAALRGALQHVLADTTGRWGRLGRARVLQKFTYEKIARDSLAVYQSMLDI